MRGLHNLNLTDAQREQIRAAAQRLRESNKAEREELRALMQTRRQGGELTPEQQARARELMQSMRASRESLHNELLTTLTPEQRTQLEQMQAERKQRREEFRQRREEFRQRRQELREQRQQEAPKP
jgi:Spy/CpxP family protein refolding chaperone